MLVPTIKSIRERRDSLVVLYQQNWAQRGCDASNVFSMSTSIKTEKKLHNEHNRNNLV
jgi:hypothetical protein